MLQLFHLLWRNEMRNKEESYDKLMEERLTYKKLQHMNSDETKPEGEGQNYIFNPIPLSSTHIQYIVLLFFQGVD